MFSTTFLRWCGTTARSTNTGLCCHSSEATLSFMASRASRRDRTRSPRCVETTRATLAPHIAAFPEAGTRAAFGKQSRDRALLSAAHRRCAGFAASETNAHPFTQTTAVRIGNERRQLPSRLSCKRAAVSRPSGGDVAVQRGRIRRPASLRLTRTEEQARPGRSLLQAADIERLAGSLIGMDQSDHSWCRCIS